MVYPTDPALAKLPARPGRDRMSDVTSEPPGGQTAVFAEPDATPFDLRFRLFGTHVRVHPLFWLISVVLGWDLTHRPILPGNGLGDLAVWVVASFLSILLHEFGHVWMGRLFGHHGHILLQGMGGLAIGATGFDTPRWKRILVSAAGPAIQLLLWAALVGILAAGYRPEPRTPLALLIGILLIINLYWPLLNLLPIWPLDGGQITRELCESVSRKGTVIALWISLVFSAVLAINAFLGMTNPPQNFIPYAPTSTWMAILFAMFAVGSWQAIQIENYRAAQRYQDDVPDDRLPWER